MTEPLTDAEIEELIVFHTNADALRRGLQNEEARRFLATIDALKAEQSDVALASNWKARAIRAEAKLDDVRELPNKWRDEQKFHSARFTAMAFNAAADELQAVLDE